MRRKSIAPKESEIEPNTYLFDGRYKIHKRIGGGTFSTVYSATDTATHAKCAIKLHKKKMSRQVLRIEYQVLQSLQGVPGICRLHKYVNCTSTQGDSDGDFIVMQLLEESLESICRRINRLQIPTAADIGIQVLDTLHAMHERGWIHRDVKPGNIMIDTNGDNVKAYLIDFGLSKKHMNDEGDVMAERTSADFRGTNKYASICVHNSQDQGRRDDIWSLWLVLLDILLGDLPWTQYQTDRDKVRELKDNFWREARQKLSRKATKSETQDDMSDMFPFKNSHALENAKQLSSYAGIIPVPHPTTDLHPVVHNEFALTDTCSQESPAEQFHVARTTRLNLLNWVPNELLCWFAEADSYSYSDVPRYDYLRELLLQMRDRFEPNLISTNPIEELFEVCFDKPTLAHRRTIALHCEKLVTKRTRDNDSKNVRDVKSTAVLLDRCRKEKIDVNSLQKLKFHWNITSHTSNETFTARDPLTAMLCHVITSGLSAPDLPVNKYMGKRICLLSLIQPICPASCRRHMVHPKVDPFLKTGDALRLRPGDVCLTYCLTGMCFGNCRKHHMRDKEMPIFIEDGLLPNIEEKIENAARTILMHRMVKIRTVDQKKDSRNQTDSGSSNQLTIVQPLSA